MAKTFDNISEASATNYLFLFAQRTLALQNEPPTPPPLNALGLPCEALCRLWAQLDPEKAAEHEFLSVYLKSIGAARTVAEKGGTFLGVAKVPAAAETAEASPSSPPPSLGQVHVVTASGGGGDKHCKPGPPLTYAASEVYAAKMGGRLLTLEEAKTLMGGRPLYPGEDQWCAVQGRDWVQVGDGYHHPGKSHTRECGGYPSWGDDLNDGNPEAHVVALYKEKTFVEKIKPLAEEITEYIQDHQDDAAQEERWRTTMKRDMGKSFRKVLLSMPGDQKVEAGEQKVKKEIQEEIKAEVQEIKEEIKAEVQEVKEEIKEEIKAEVQKVKEEMQQRFDDVHSKLDEKLDRIVEDLARLTAV